MWSANSDDIAADARKGEKGALDYISLEGHMGQYHDHQSRNEVKKDDALPWFRYVNKAVNDYLVRDDTTPIILCCDEEYETAFRKLSTLRHLLPVGIKKDPAGLDGKALLEESLAVMDDFDAIGMALAERRVGALFLVKGKILPGGFDINTGTVTFDGDPNPVDDGYIDPAAPDITDAFAQAALAQDAHIYIVEQNQMPTDQPVAALFRYAE